MNARACVGQLKATKAYFDRSTRCLEEDDSTFAPTEGAMTVAQQVAHVAHTIDWFMEGGFRPEGFDLDFEGQAKEYLAVTSLAAAREWLDRAFASAIETTASKSGEELAEALPDGIVMGGMPRFSIYGSIQDHTAHHRGVLTVYSRHRGHTPAMPYMDM
ncbi:MAG: DinB family protein [Thermoanaerobaculia bacterium]